MRLPEACCFRSAPSMIAYGGGFGLPPMSGPAKGRSGSWGAEGLGNSEERTCFNSMILLSLSLSLSLSSCRSLPLHTPLSLQRSGSNTSVGMPWRPTWEVLIGNGRLPAQLLRAWLYRVKLEAPGFLPCGPHVIVSCSFGPLSRIPLRQKN